MRAFLQEFFTGISAPDTPGRRLRIAAWVRLTGVVPVVYLPTGIALVEGLGDASHAVAGGRVCLAWLALTGLMIASNLALLGLGGWPRASRRLTYLSLTAELGTSLLAAYSVGILTSTSAVYLIVIVALYRVFFDFRLGLYAVLVGSTLFALLAGLGHAGWIPYGPSLPEFTHPYLGDGATAAVVVQTFLSGALLTFFAVNYAVNQSVRLHRYITESVLRRYLPPSLVARAAEGELKLDGEPERRVVTVMFTDLVGFTALSERLGPDEVGRVLNRYLTRMADLAHARGATVDKFVGDAVMVVFGAPDELAPHLQARECVALALDMLRAARGMSESVPLEFRAGINTGEAVVGHFGSSLRSDFTVIGHTVNVAARLESASTPGRVLVGEQTAALLGGEFEVEPAGELALKNVAGRVRGFFVVEGEARSGAA